MEVKRQNHEFPPVYDENSEILSFPEKHYFGNYEGSVK